MKRKLVKQGAATLMVSIPAKWAKQHNLDKGSEVEVIETPTQLNILGESEKSLREIKIKITEENKKSIQNMLTHAYRKGFETIRLQDTSREIVRKVQQITDNILLGFEVTSRSDNECTIENVSEPSNKKYTELLKRIILLNKDMHKSLVNDLKLGKYESSIEIEGMHQHIDKLTLFCKRLLFKETGEDVSLNWEMLTFLMQIGHKYYYLYEYAKNKSVKADTDIINILNQLEKYYSLLENSIVNKDTLSIHKINELKEDYHFGKIPSMLEKSNGKKSVILSHINELFRLIQISSSPALAIALNS